MGIGDAGVSLDCAHTDHSAAVSLSKRPFPRKTENYQLLAIPENMQASPHTGVECGYGIYAGQNYVTVTED